MCEHENPQVLLLRGADREVFAHAHDCRGCRTELLAGRAYPPGCSDPLLGYRVQLHLERLLCGDDGDHTALRAHLAVCPACRLERAEAEAALNELGPPPRGPSTCPHCEAPVALSRATCATCASPHHAQCFEQHGRCGLQGCGDSRYVRSVPPRRSQVPRWLLGGLLGFLVTTSSEPEFPAPTLQLNDRTAVRVD